MSYRIIQGKIGRWELDEGGRGTHVVYKPGSFVDLTDEQLSQLKSHVKVQVVDNSPEFDLSGMSWQEAVKYIEDQTDENALNKLLSMESTGKNRSSVIAAIQTTLSHIPRE